MPTTLLQDILLWGNIKSHKSYFQLLDHALLLASAFQFLGFIPLSDSQGREDCSHFSELQLLSLRDLPMYVTSSVSLHGIICIIWE